jgi:hypothetical protein
MFLWCARTTVVSQNKSFLQADEPVKQNLPRTEIIHQTHNIEAPHLQNLGLHVLDAAVKVFEVASQEGAIDLHERVLTREVHRKSHEEALQARVDDEGSCCRVHDCNVLRVADLLQRELAAVVPALASFSRSMLMSRSSCVQQAIIHKPYMSDNYFTTIMSQASSNRPQQK